MRSFCSWLVPRPIRFIVHESIYRIGWLNPIFKLIEAIPISNVRAKEALREAADRIRKGEIVCIFPEGELSRTGTLIETAQRLRINCPIGRVRRCPGLAGRSLGLNLFVRRRQVLS